MALPTTCNVTPIGKRLNLKVGIGLTPGVPNQQLNSRQVYGYAYAAGFTGQFADKIVAIARAESGWNTAWYNLHSNGQCDRGLVQINDIQNNGSPGWGPCLPDACAYDPLCAMQWAKKVVGTNFGNFNAYWVTSAQGLDKKFLTNGPVGGPAIAPGQGSGAVPSGSPSSGGSSGSGSGAITSGTGAISSAGNAITQAAYKVISSNPVQAISPNADMTAFLGVVDNLMALTNPFTTNMSNIPMDNIAGIVSFTDPFAWVEQVGTNIFDDLTALIIRLIFLGLGAFLIIKVLGEFIDYEAIGEAVSNTAKTVGSLALLA